ncbi:isocitrate lyase/PEP mutase family protein [Actinomarinicola tropica]|uniref:Isocitrate lyase/phosphoenolpyruvate mutase family protein n=1 Tax=Actinomarinicola tropica TaxID=2789776 RepID=A0A5Q2RH57_9ACTN|nr:isocitrate lyase/phosphoenolpyruvate mutase family protein [Actinomarinicola tropica]QGG96169.1 isocitrate lyase/phosphoenolpyruvate mutase family protein [Actinomarinicola tropica]
MTTRAFRELHRAGTFVMPNPWDRGSARALEAAGFPALATTSSGFARSLGRNDQETTRDELVAHVADLAAVLSVPLSVDGERLFPGDPGGIPETVRLLADAGAAGCSIEDHDPARGAVVPMEEAVAAVRDAAEACARHDLVLTARAENHLYGVGDLDDTIERLVAFRDAGADVVYAPGLLDAGDIERVVREVGRPVNVLALPGTPSVAELAALGVRRVSTGGALQSAAYEAARQRALALRDGA